MRTQQCVCIQDELTSYLDRFEPISLEEMDHVRLLDRVDTKYVMTFDQLLTILGSLSEHYRILTIGHNRKNSYRTNYFDTPGFEMYNQHHNGLANRYKIRTREYVDSGLSFSEIKFKDNKNRTTKKRIEIDGDTPDYELKRFIGNKSSFDGDELVFVLKNTYTRLTFVHKDTPERLTIDLDMVCYDNEGNTVKFDNVIIAELKQGRLSNKSDFMALMHEMNIRPRKFSKYCMGVSFLYDGVKKNNFKENMILVDKIKEGVTA